MTELNDLFNEMQKNGYNVTTDKFVPDGKIHRFDKDGKKDAWAVGYQNHTRAGHSYIVARFGSWKTGEQFDFQSNVTMTRDDKKAVQGDIEKAQKQLEIEREKRREEAALASADLWALATENPKSDYLKRKQIRGLYGAKTHVTYSGRELFVPLRDVDGKLWGIQRIFPDGTKIFMEGQRKKSCFHVIPFADALETEEVIYIAEGFATAASVHESIEKPVVVAFDSGNLLSVARALKEKYPDKAIIICGDDDRFTKDKDDLPTNPGRLAAEETAKQVLGKTIYPVFVKDNGKLTDFNDLALSEGLAAVRNIILGVKPEFHAVHALGYHEENYYFISSDKPVVTTLTAGSFAKNSLMSLMPLEYWESTFPSKQNSVAWDLAINTLMKSCREKGIFVPKSIRGAGVWKDNGRTVVNLGDSLWVNGDVLAYREHKSKYIYQASSQVVVPSKNFATSLEMVELQNAFEMLSWKKPEYAYFLIGWIMTAQISGCLKWRPHVWITGPSGSGKSYVMNSIINIIFGNNALKVLGNTSEAGIRSEIKSDARPLVFDELETDDDRSGERVKSVIELCRQASSETDAQVIKGSPAGKSISFAVRFSAAVSSIRPNLQHEQDKNRFSLLELDRNEKNNFIGPDGIQKKFQKILTPEFIEKLFSRSVHKVDLILSNHAVFFDVMSSRFNGRFADQYGTLLAGYFAAIQDEPVSVATAEAVLNSYIKLDEQAESLDAHDEFDCLEHLMKSTARHGVEAMTIAELIERHNKWRPDVMMPTDAISPFQETLMRYGVKVLDPANIAVQISNPELSKIFSKKKWTAGWATPLKRIPGSVPNASLRFHGTKSKCVKVPISNQPLADDGIQI